MAEALRARPALGRLITRPGQPTPPAGAGDDDAGRLQLFDAVAGVLGDVGETGAPVLLVIEDLHWADQSTRDLLSFLLARLRSERLAVVASYRADDLHRRHPLRPLLGELVRLPTVERVELSPFTPSELRDYLRALSGEQVPEPLVRDVLARSDGNAYFAEELYAAGLGSGEEGQALPTALADVLLARLERLPAPVQRIARVASVAGRRVSHPLLQAASGLSEAEVEEALREAVTHHVLVAEGGDRYAFRHALLQEAVYGDLLPGERVRLHGTYARLLADGVEGAGAAELAYHCLQSHDLAGALSASIRAAAEAAELHAPVEALRNLEQALQLWHAVPDAAERAGCDLISVGLRAASAAASAGELHRAVALAAAARDLADREAPGSRQAASTRHKLALHLLGADRPEEAYEATAEALEMLPEPAADADPGVVRRHPRPARRSTSTATRRVGTGPRRRWPAPASSDLADAEADALASLALVAESEGDSEKAQARLAEARDRAAAAGDLAVELRATYNLAGSHYYAGELAGRAGGARRRGEPDRGDRPHLQPVRVGAAGPAGDRAVRGRRLGRQPGGGRAGRRPHAGLGAGPAGRGRALRRGVPRAARRGRAGAPAARRLEPGHQPGAARRRLRGRPAALARRPGRGGAGGRQRDRVRQPALGEVVSGRHLAGRARAGRAGRPGRDRAAARRRGGRRRPTVARGRELIEHARTTAQRGRPRHGRMGPEGQGWLARAEAEWSRLDGRSDPELWRARAARCSTTATGTSRPAAGGGWPRRCSARTGGRRPRPR